MSEKFDLTSLCDFIDRTLTLTEAVKDTLIEECAEARFALSPWKIKTVVTKEVDQNACTCNKISSSESQVEEISVGISKALLQTQQLREKFSLDATKSSRKSKIFDFHGIYGHKSVSLGNSKSKSLPSLNAKSNFIKPLKLQTKSVNKNTKSTQWQAVRTKSSDHKCENVEKESLEEQQAQNIKKSSLQVVSDCSVSSKSSNRSKEKKNFLVQNKLNIKKIVQDNKNKQISQNSARSPRGKESSSSQCSAFQLTKRKPVISAASTNELNKLIEKLSSFENTPSTSYDVNKNDCPLHGENTSQFVEEVDTISMDIVDSITTFGLPKDISKTLKIYHTYLNIDSKEKSSQNTKRQKAANKFLTEFQELNDIKEQSYAQNSFLKLLTKFISTFGSAFDESCDKINLKKIQEIDKTLVNQIEEFDINQYKRKEDVDPLFRYPDVTGWLSNGIWNLTCIKDLREMSKAHCIYYSDTTELLSFFGTLQKLQRTEYHNKIIEIILHDVIPQMKRFFKPTDVEYMQIYRMIAILSQGLNPKNPVLVKTED